ncbi:MAG: DUF932 domain-containing protein [Verrucomicrobia bacterium]|nr:DUF932 domain-containing protein [Verrucomicrobiota bacterium]
MNILTLQEIARIAPSALATRAKPGLSARYAFLSTAEAIRIHGDQGWLPVSARQARTRIPGYDGFTRHEIVFRRLTDKPALELGEVIPELRLVNSHAGQCSYQLHAGLMRLVCRNGLVAPASAAGRLRVRHTVQEVQELADRLKDVSARLAGWPPRGCACGTGIVRIAGRPRRRRWPWPRAGPRTRGTICGPRSTGSRRMSSRVGRRFPERSMSGAGIAGESAGWARLRRGSGSTRACGRRRRRWRWRHEGMAP